MRAHRGVVPATLSTLVLLVLTGSAPVGAATPTCAGRDATIVGTGGADTLVGTRRNDVIVSLGGDDVVSGRGGDDVVCGGAGADRVLGGPGADRLFGERDRLDDGPAGTALVGDVLDGGPGDDRLDGGRDDRHAASRTRPDTYSWASIGQRVVVDASGPGPGLATGGGDDRLVLAPGLGLVGSSQGDRITGTSGPDRIDGGAGDDTIASGGGSDRVYPDGLRGTPGDDRVSTGSGDDLVSSLAGRDVILTGPGEDYVEAFSPRPARIETGPGDDYLGQSLVRGRGAAGHGGDGDDVVALYGGPLEGSATSYTVDLVDRTTRATGVTSRGVITGVEGLRLMGGLRWEVAGTSRSERVWAVQGGPLRVTAGGGNDRLTGSERADRLLGGPGTDTGFGRGGDDTCRGVERGDC